LTGTVTAATRRTWWITGPFLARRAAHPNPNLNMMKRVFLLRKKMNGRKWIMVLSYVSQKQCFSAR
jgi:hypothetical protein